MQQIQKNFTERLTVGANEELLHSTKLKPILVGVSSKGVLRVDQRTKEVLDMWEYQVLKNWTNAKRTFVC